MFLLGYQQSIASILEADEMLAAAELKAFAAGDAGLERRVAEALAQKQTVTAIVNTREARVLGRTGVYLCVDLDPVEITFSEKPALNRGRKGHMDAQSAALRAAAVLDQDNLRVQGFSEEVALADGREVVVNVVLRLKGSARLPIFGAEPTEETNENEE